MKTVMLVFGTRPEAIKMCPLIGELKKRSGIRTMVCVTGQHRQMLDGVLEAFGVVPDVDLDIMKEGQTLFDVTGRVLLEMGKVLEEANPDTVLVHGDTTTAFAAALACYYKGTDVGHVEAGLRTYDIYNPYPEEFNRRAVGIISKYNFAPTEAAKQNLLREGAREDGIFVTGNTVIDALKSTVRADYSHSLLDWVGDSRLVLLTAHRRESLGETMEGMLGAIRRVVSEHPDVKVIYPVHMNPAVRKVAYRLLGGEERIRITEPLDVLDFHNILAKSHMVITDSGGIQEEAPALGKPIVLMRETTERPEGVKAGTVILAGTSEGGIYESFRRLLDDKKAYDAMARAKNPYGDGFASRRIADILEK